MTFKEASMGTICGLEWSKDILVGEIDGKVRLTLASNI